MLKNYFIIAWRNMVRNPVYAAINIAGLAIGLAVCMMIVLYVGHEKNFDGFHADAERIFRVQSKINLGNDSLYMPYLGYNTAALVKQNEPAVENFLRVKEENRNTVIQNPLTPSLKFTENRFLFSDSNFFSFFSFPLLRGDKITALENPFTVVISEEAAKKYFASEDPVGKIIRYNNAHDFVITGVSKTAPSNSTIQFDFVASASSLLTMPVEKDLIAANENIFTTYFLINAVQDVTRLETALQQLEKNKSANNQVQSRYIGTALTNLHLQAGDNTSHLKYLRTFSLVALLVLLLAVINYASLATARAATRAKEVGVRKVLGAGQRIIAIQFAVESFFYTSIAFVLGYILCIAFQPFFFRFLQIDIDGSFLYYPRIILSFGILFIATVILSSSYPSILLSAYKPVQVLYGHASATKGSLRVRNLFTIFQFAIAAVLIICSLVIFRQMNFLRHSDTGVSRDNVMMISFSPEAGKHYTAFNEKLESIPGIQQVSVALHPLYKGFDMMGTKPANSDKMILLPTLSVDQHFISLLQLQWKIKPTDSLFFNKKDVAILNETAAQELNITSPGAKLDDRFEVAGILKDFNYTSLQNRIAPLCIFIVKDNDSAALWAKNGGAVFLRLNPHTNIPSLVNKVRESFEMFSADMPFEYRFMDDAFDEMYRSEDRLLKILAVFTVFTIIIACVGLFGLAAFSAVRRTKEIGIRKVLGASVASIITVLSKDFLKLIVVAALISFPVAWWAAHTWLQDFAYRVNISWWLFVLSAAALIGVALVTIFFQTIKAAMANPVKNLRTE